MIQSLTELEAFYNQSDPWGYETNTEDQYRKERILEEVGSLKPRRTLDIGCGNGFITKQLPGESVVGVDISTNAINICKQQIESSKFNFLPASIFDLSRLDIGSFDLILITGVLYPQYIGHGGSLIRLIVDKLLNEKGSLVSVHISAWNPVKFQYPLVRKFVYPYREYFHQVEHYVK